MNTQRQNILIKLEQLESNLLSTIQENIKEQIDWDNKIWDSILNNSVIPEEESEAKNIFEYFYCADHAIYTITMPKYAKSYNFDTSISTIMKFDVINPSILKWIQYIIPFDEICLRAVEYQKLKLLKWARTQNPPYMWDEHTSEEASRIGNLKILKFLIENGCPWNEYSLYYAIEEGHLDIIKWIFNNADISDKSYVDLDYYASTSLIKHPMVIKWLRKNNLLGNKFKYFCNELTFLAGN